MFYVSYVRKKTCVCAWFAHKCVRVYIYQVHVKGRCKAITGFDRVKSFGGADEVLFFYPVTVRQQNSQPSIPIKVFAGSVNPVCSHSTSILIQVERWEGKRRRGGTQFYALTHCGKNSFRTHLLYSSTNSYRRRGGRGARGKNNKMRNKNRKENRNYICILTSHSKLLESRPTTASVQAACQWKEGENRRR